MCLQTLGLVTTGGALSLLKLGCSDLEIILIVECLPFHHIKCVSTQQNRMVTSVRTNVVVGSEDSN